MFERIDWHRRGEHTTIGAIASCDRSRNVFLVHLPSPLSSSGGAVRFNSDFRTVKIALHVRCARKCSRHDERLVGKSVPCEIPQQLPRRAADEGCARRPSP
jgi:hypothetical protein